MFPFFSVVVDQGVERSKILKVVRGRQRTGHKT